MNPPPKHPVCPFCYQRIDPRSITFRCSFRDGDEECGQTFRADGTQVDAFCPNGHPSTRLRQCPYCAKRLPTLFGRTDARLIAMMGATFSGKTVYLTTLVREWNGRVGDRFGSTMMAVDDSTIDRFNTLRAALDHKGIIPGTDKVEPYVFTIDIPGPRLTRKLTCSFLDSPGEVQVSAESMERYVRYISSADGIILLLDPVTMPGAAGYLEAGQGTDREKADNLAVVQRLVSYMVNYGGSRERAEPVATPPRRSLFRRRQQEEEGEERIDVPVAVVLTKTDAVQSGLGELADLLRHGHHEGYYDTSEAPAIDSLVRDLMRRWDGPEIEHLLKANFRDVRFFAASSLGHPTEDGRVNTRGWHPKRVEDPLLWLLSEFDLIPSRPGDRS